MLTKISGINKSVPIPLYFQLKELILSEIKNGNYKTGSLIPTEKEFSDSFQISRTTVRQAITELVQEGWLYRVKSKGTYVSQPKITQDYIKKVESFNDQMYRSGLTPSTEVLELKTLKADDTIAKNLRLQEKDLVIFLHRKRSANGEPIVTSKTYLPFKECSFILEHDLRTEQLYTILSNKEETRIFRIERIVEAVEAKTADVKLLGMKRGKPIQHFTSVGYSVFDKPIEYTLSRYRGDRNSFEVTVCPGS
ncbi:MAG: GntR family transcriptional regulator [Lachnospiraceae bacterium]